jgi:hypothetical protein
MGYYRDSLPKFETWASYKAMKEYGVLENVYE